MTEPTQKADRARRNRGFSETHREMIATAVRLISEKGADALSISALARAMGINRTTVYYHFDSREALLHAVTAYATEQLARGMDSSASRPERTAGISRFVLENPDLITLWIDDFIGGGDIRQSYSNWDELVAGVKDRLAQGRPDDAIDAEVYCVMLLVGAIIGPHVYSRSVRRGEAVDVVAQRFAAELQRTLTRDGVT